MKTKSSKKPPMGAPPPTASGIPVHCAHGAIVDVAKLVPNPRNPNKHPESQVAILAKIIKHQGWRSPIVVSKRSGFIVKGHGRYEAAKLLGVEQVPVDHQDYQNEACEWADLIADNRISELAETDEDLLKELLAELKSELPDIEFAGFTDAEFDTLIGSVGASAGTTSSAAPGDFPKADEGIKTDHTCPKCGYKFSGGK